MKTIRFLLRKFFNSRLKIVAKMRGSWCCPLISCHQRPSAMRDDLYILGFEFLEKKREEKTNLCAPPSRRASGSAAICLAFTLFYIFPSVFHLLPTCHALPGGPTTFSWAPFACETFSWHPLFEDLCFRDFCLRDLFLGSFTSA